jgi:hypothetical protein
MGCFSFSQVQITVDVVVFKSFKAFNRCAPFNPNSVVAVAAKSEEQTFHSEAMPMGYCL